MVELSSPLKIAERRRAAAWLHFLSKQTPGYVHCLPELAEVRYSQHPAAAVKTLGRVDRHGYSG
jgi:hypothetical protein